MLKNLEIFRSSLDDAQREAIRIALPADLSDKFFETKEEPDAEQLIEKINEYLRIKPMIAFELFKILNSKQKVMISDLIDDEV